jgi:hypothetical protein
MSTETDERQIDERQIAGMSEKQKATWRTVPAWPTAILHTQPSVGS